MANKLFYSAILAMVAVFMFSSTPVEARKKSESSSSITRVRGNIFDTSGPVGELSVSVTCKGVTKTTTTDDFGLYVIDFSSGACPKYTPVSAQATHNSEPQSHSVLVSEQNTATMDFYFGATSVPEFGMIGGALATFTSGGAFLLLRKRFGL